MEESKPFPRRWTVEVSKSFPKGWTVEESTPSDDDEISNLGMDGGRIQAVPQRMCEKRSNTELETINAFRE